MIFILLSLAITQAYSWQCFVCAFITTCFNRQHGQDTKEELASRDLRAELESKEREAKEKRDGKTRSFTGQYQCYIGVSN